MRAERSTDMGLIIGAGVACVGIAYVGLELFNYSWKKRFGWRWW